MDLQIWQETQRLMKIRPFKVVFWLVFVTYQISIDTLFFSTEFFLQIQMNLLL